ncbi:MAG: Na+/proline symporter [Gammaproteobacteria bacterium]|nr:Na+/proline symporter [Gammaproteobacteria bacterium]NIR83104.1 Na+/proline symporter [Gammaproteobacteria bacterium]NIR90766.1 Na+/proline symporter [Gammaproteobacteria bacterium]NIU04257.1 Na+/proline symporter [Gammaproteobacteria bacterium]NIV51549.1 Na+/proline symporter [Gammaproteobacteria bacterium]
MTSALAIGTTLATALIFAMLGIWHMRNLRLSVEEYIVSRKSLGAGASLATVTASVIGAWILFSPAEAATWAGIAGVIGYALGQAAPLLALAVIGPRMRALMPQGHSLTEYAWHRYGPPMYVLTLLLMLFYMFVFLSAELTAISRTLQLVADIPLVWTALIVAAGTLAYTCYGGLRASMFTDGIQFTLIIPLLLVTFFVVLGELGGLKGAFGPVAGGAPQLLSLNHRAGAAFGFTLVIAILAANLFHQGFWQRIYACRDATAIRKSFYASGLVVIPIVLLAGLFGLMAVGQEVPPEQASVALFVLAVESLPTWALLVLLILALALVMSSMDTALNGIASTVTTDLARFRPNTRVGGLLRSSRVLTIITAIPAVFIAALGQSVLYLFLIADLVCAAAVVPVFYGLYARRFTGTGALASAVGGLLVGAMFFPKPDFQPWFRPDWLAVHPDFQFLASFGSALLVSSAIALAWNVAARLRAPDKIYDFERLTRNVRLIEG